jgi:hypothetical protein
LALKVGKIIGQVKPEALRDSKQTAQSMRQQAYQSLKSRRVEAPAKTPATPPPSPPPVPPKSPMNPSRPYDRTYVLDYDKKYTPKGKTAPVAVQEGGR